MLIVVVIGLTVVCNNHRLQSHPSFFDVLICPGYIVKNTTTKWSYKPLKTKVISINSEKNDLKSAIPGGLIGVQLNIDPGFAAKDGLVGHLVTTSENISNFKVYETLFISFNLLDRLNSLNIQKDDILIINCNSNNTKGQVVKVKGHKMEITLLENPICLELGDYLTLSKMVDKNIVIIGRGKVLDGILSNLQE